MSLRKMMVLSTLASLAAVSGFSEVIEHPKDLKAEAKIYEKAQKRWMWSTVALVGASFADVHSSWGKMEANGLLRSSNGTFGAKGFGIKMGIVGGIVLGQYVVVNKNPGIANAVSWVNFGMTGLKVATAARNYRIEKPKYLLREQ